MPSAAKPCPERQPNRICSIRPRVSSGDVVGTVSRAIIASGPLARMATHLVPPSSTPAYAISERLGDFLDGHAHAFEQRRRRRAQDPARVFRQMFSRIAVCAKDVM